MMIDRLWSGDMAEIQILCKESVIAEALGTFGAIVENAQNTFCDLLENGNEDFLEVIAFFEKWPLKGMEIGNLFLEIDPFLTRDDFFKKLMALDALELQYHILSEEIPRETIQSALEDRGVLENFISESPYIHESRFEDILWVFHNPDKLKHYIELGLSQSVQWNVEHRNEMEAKIKLFLEFSEKQLQKVAPLEYAQQLMGKKFKRISSYKQYIFIPLYYSHLNCMRFFNDECLIVLDRVGSDGQITTADDLGRALKVLSDPTRLEILSFISNRPAYGIELSDKFNVSRPTISHHLEQMNSVGLVHVERVKNTKYYSLNKRRYRELIQELNTFLLKDE